MKRVIVDTGPLVAYFRESDHNHAWAKSQFQCYSPPFWTCEPVLTEAAFLLNRFGGNKNVEYLLALAQQGVLRVDFNLIQESKRLSELIRQYQNVPMSLADACVVRMAEQYKDSLVLTLDSDFNIYRINGRKTVPLITNTET